MSEETTQAAEAIRSIWQGNPATMAELDDECNPNKVCRNMKDVSYDGFGDEALMWPLPGRRSWPAKASLPPAELLLT